MSIKNVLLLGADGTLGTFILDRLTASTFHITVLKRVGSKSPDNYASHVKVKKIADEMTTEQLAEALHGQDAAVLSIKGSQVDLQKRVADACVKAGVKRLIPADFGSCDSSSARAQELVPLFKNKTDLRTYLMETAKSAPAFTWTALVTGHLFDYLDFMKVYPADKRIEILDDGQYKASYSTRDRVGEAVVHVLERPEESANQVLFVQSFCVTELEIVAAFEKASSASWKVVTLDSKEYEKAEVAKRDNGDADAIENLVWLLGTVDGDWEKKPNFAMDKLGLKNQDLNAVVKQIMSSA